MTSCNTVDTYKQCLLNKQVCRLFQAITNTWVRRLWWKASFTNMVRKKFIWDNFSLTPCQLVVSLICSHCCPWFRLTEVAALICANLTTYDYILFTHITLPGYLVFPYRGYTFMKAGHPLRMKQGQETVMNSGCYSFNNHILFEYSVCFCLHFYIRTALFYKGFTT